MYISKKNREVIRLKLDGKCAYTGTPLKDDWQIDHVVPILRTGWKNDALREYEHRLDNMIPVQKIVNHYKGALNLEDFRNWYLAGLHERLGKLPKNPRTEKSKRKKAYLLEVAELFGITRDKPFSGKFHMEKKSCMK